MYNTEYIELCICHPFSDCTEIIILAADLSTTDNECRTACSEELQLTLVIYTKKNNIFL